MLALQLPGAPPGASEHVSFVWYIVVFLLLIVLALVVLLTKRRERIEIISEKKASGLEGLLKTRDTELADERRAKEKTLEDLLKALEDLSEVNSELKVVSGIKVHELAEFWAKKGEIEVELEALRSQVRTLKGTLRKWERGELKLPEHTDRRP